MTRRQLKYCRDCGKERSEKDLKDYHIIGARCRKCLNLYCTNKSKEQRYDVLSHYSITNYPQCECCGEATYEFLVLDHKYGGGTKHRKENSYGQNGVKMYNWAIKNNYPEIFRVLCDNCNASYGRYGYCPHQRKQELLNEQTA